VLLDTNGDGAEDLGQYYLSRYEFLITDLVTNPLVLVQEMNYPPVIRDGQLSWSSPPISSSGAQVYDLECLDAETPSNLLEKKFIWKVDGVLVPEVTGNSLPAQYLENASTIEVSLTVSDGEVSVSTPVLQDTVFHLPVLVDIPRQQHILE
jgi:hypothetical protein